MAEGPVSCVLCLYFNVFIHHLKSKLIRSKLVQTSLVGTVKEDFPQNSKLWLNEAKGVFIQSYLLLV